MVQRALVTGGNKGIGLAITRGLLNAGTFVFLGSRDLKRGQDAVNLLIGENSSFADRLRALQLDVTDAGSVSHAVATVRETNIPLSILVHNAGATPTGDSLAEIETCLDINLHGVVRVTDAFLPLLDQSTGRIVILSSGAAPNFVESCSAERQRILTDPNVTMPQIQKFVSDYTKALAEEGDADENLNAVGMGRSGAMSAYGCSKACVNMYMMLLAREHPTLQVNSCTPGLIATDLLSAGSRRFGFGDVMKNAKSPDEGAKTPVFLALGKVPGNGWYFGSDGKRSPLDRYRDPGSAPYDGK